MYPQANLEALAQRKQALLSSIRTSRAECAAHLSVIAKPIVWAEGLYARWKAVSPIVKVAAVPVGVMLKRKLFPKGGGGFAAGLLRWAPVAADLFRSRR